MTLPRRVLVAAAVLALVVALVRVLDHEHPGRPDAAARLTAATTVPSVYTAFPRQSLARSAKPATGTWAGRTYRYVSLVSAWTTPARAFTQLVPSWSATTPAGSWIQVLVRVRDSAGGLSSVKDLGHWSTRDATFRRSSPGVQRDAVARVSTDTLVATGRALTAYRITVRLMSTAGGAAPILHMLGAVTSTPPAALPATSVPLDRRGFSLAVPRYSQMIHRGESPQYGGGGEAWCSPTSLAMILGYYGRLPAPSTYTWVPTRYADRWVDHVARLTYDAAYQGTGNWPFNTAYAATRTGDAFVTRLANLRMAARFLRAGIPLALSIRFSKGQLSGAPISATAGHLVVLAGFTASGDPIVNDPAASSDATVRRVYDRAQFERAWLGGSDGMAYVVHDAAHPLPPRPSGVANW